MEGARNAGGVYITGSPNTSITFCDFYNNSGGNFSGYIPPGLGVLVSVNANGDPCDVYNNILLDPMFVNPSLGDYHLQAGSPCIDAGDPQSPLDPDGTVADIGVNYYHQTPVISLTLTPHNPPIIIPAGGGSFVFDINLENLSPNPIDFDAWTEVVLPNGNTYGPLILRTGLVLPVNGSISRRITQNVPGSAPPGTYNFLGCAGTHPNVVLDSDDFDFEKIADE